MSGSSLKETDPTMQIYEAQAIIIEQNEEISRMRQEIERLRVENSNKNQLELAQKVAKLEEDLASKNDSLAELLESLSMKQNRNQEELSKKMSKIEEDLTDNFESVVTKLKEDLAASKADNLQLKEQITTLHLNISKSDNLSNNEEELVANQTQNATRTENKVETQSEEQQNTSVLILGDSGDSDSIYLLNSKARSWRKLIITIPMEMSDFGAAVVNEEIYIFGGSQLINLNITCHHHCYKLKDDGSWMKLASLNKKRAYISSSSLVYKGDIWVIGGYSGKNVLKSVEKYDISQDKWTYMPKMNYARWCAAAAVFKDRLFVTGGVNEEKLFLNRIFVTKGKSEKILKSVEMFDPKLQKWILFCDLPFELSSHTMLISNSILSIFGGESESGELNSVWEMNIDDSEKKWAEKQSFKHPRSRFGIGKLSNEIIVFGGYREETSEIFDGNGWIDGPKLAGDLSSFAYTTIPRSLEESFLEKFS